MEKHMTPRHSNPVMTEEDMVELGGPFFDTSFGRWLTHRIYSLLDINKVNKLHDKYGEYSGHEFTERILADHLIRVQYDLHGEENLRYMQEGPFIAVANHPFGGLDGIMLIDIISRVRPDFKLVVNGFLSRIEALKDSFISTQPILSRKGYSHIPTDNIAGIRQMARQLDSGSPLGLFPAGSVAQEYDSHLGMSIDQPWQSSSIRLIQKAKVPVFPILFIGSNSRLYHLLKGNFVLKNLKVPTEIFNKKGETIRVYLGNPIPTQEMNALSSLEELRDLIYHRTLSLHPLL